MGLFRVKWYRMTVRTKSIFAPIDEDDGHRILITRFYPRGVRKTHFDEWLTSLSPRPDLLFGYKNGEMNWDSFKDSFIKQLKGDLDSLEAIHTINDLSKTSEVTLLCFEKSGNPCHRHIVRDIVENPSLLESTFETEYADDHKRIAV